MPNAIRELDGLRAVVAQRVRCDLALVAFLREHHDHASARPHVLDVMLQVFVLVAERPNQRPLKLGEVPVLGARGIRAVEVRLLPGEQQHMWLEMRDRYAGEIARIRGPTKDRDPGL